MISVKCMCGGTTTVDVEPTQQTAIVECVCSRIVLWSREEPADASGTLAISVSDSSETSDKVGG